MLAARGEATSIIARSITEHIIIGSILTISYFSKGWGGADIGPLHRRTGTPMFGLSIDGQKYFEIHHTAKDVFEAVHPREMELGTASMASLVYLIDKYGL